MDSKEFSSGGYKIEKDPARNHDKYIRMRTHYAWRHFAKFRKGKFGNLLPCDGCILLYFIGNANYRNGLWDASIDLIVDEVGMSRARVLESIRRLIEHRCITKTGKTGDRIRFKLNPCFYETRGGRYWKIQDRIFNEHSPIKEHHDFKDSPSFG
jgi:hypothetical protein